MTLRHPPQPALGVTVNDSQLTRVDLGRDDLLEILADHPRIVDPRLEEQALAHRMDRDLEHPGKPVPFPGIKRQVVVTELEIGGIEVAKVLELIVQARPPAAVRAGKPHRIETQAPQQPVGRSTFCRLASASR